MTVAELRKEMNLSLDAFAAVLGLSSKGYASDLEKGSATPSVKVALELERLSDGRIDAAQLSPDVARVRLAKSESQDAAA